jgi:hypothetical protein
VFHADVFARELATGNAFRLPPECPVSPVGLMPFGRTREKSLLATRRLKMNLASKVLVASALALSFAAPALAQVETQTSLERNVFLFTPDGRMIKMTDSGKSHVMAMKHFKPLTAETMIYVSGGKAYIAQNTKMGSGKMLSQEIFGDDFVAEY